MYRAKEQGRNNFQVFTEEMQARITHRLSIETKLRRALERNEFTLHYQPQVDLVSGRIVSAEALIRWQHPEMGLVSPAMFVPLAEETGLIVPIGEWVLDAACTQTKAWLNAGFNNISIGVNLSARQFRQKNLLQIIEQSLRVNQLNSLHLELELTESMVMQDPEVTIHILNQLKQLGIRLSLDDFGTGYSSLSYLRRFPIDVLKVDQSFIRDVTTNADDACITSSIISLAHGLQLSVIAEGVETREQLRYLKQQKCDVMQGYYFSRPLPADQFFALMQADKRLSASDLGAGSADFRETNLLNV
jgi:EAL domain-containing protein (putative c-di-GMP-specific phosphodiesterase class I)